MQAQVIDKVLEEVSNFPLEEQEFIIDILNKRVIEEKRDLILKEYKRSMRNYKSGKIKKGTTSDLFKVISK